MARFRKSIFPIITLILIGLEGFGQFTGSRMVPIRIKKGSYIRMNDSLYYFNSDTTLILRNYYINDVIDPKTSTTVFYDSLKAKASRSKITKGLYDLVIVSPPGQSIGHNPQRGTSAFESYNGSIIREITFERLSPFGRTIDESETDSPGDMGGLLNKTHIVTREYIIKNYLLFESGDSLSSFLLSESERILRKLSFIDDARIIVIPVGEQLIDIHIVTKDVYSIGLTASLDGIIAGRAEIFERNLFGFGHEVVVSFPYNYDRYNAPGFGISYRANNLSRSLIDATLSYFNAFGKEYYDATFSREFLTASTKYAGGLSIRETYTTEDLDTLQIPEPLEYNNFDVWAGRSFAVSSDGLTRMVFSGRYINNNVYKRPEITSTSYRSLQKYKLYLASVALSTQEFYKTSYVFNYRRSEDFAYGALIQFTTGLENNEFKNRNYYAMEASYGDFNRNIGYLYGRLQLSTFMCEGSYEQSLMKMELKYISNLMVTRRSKNRFFANINYTKGFNRYEDEFLRVNEKYGIRGFDNDSIRTNERISLNLEAVNFSPINLLGFKFIFFGFSDMVFARKNETLFSLNKMISEIGLGLRIRNDNLIFNTIQLRISYFPTFPDWSELQYFNIAGEKLLRPPEFSPGAPAIYPYR
jgi:hypothetical protein